MMVKTCERCGAEFAPKTQWQRFCTTNCRLAVLRKHLQKTCPQCGISFETRRLEQLYCGRGCARRAEVAAKYEAGLLTPKRIATCPHCGTPSKGALACADCRQMVEAERNKRYCNDCGAITTRWKWYCAACALKHKKDGAIPNHFNARARHLLRKVWGDAWGGFYEPLSSGAIRERYRQQHAPCAICADAIDYGAKAPDPMALSLDHIVALANGGTHYEDNIQPAHFICNSYKGAKRQA